MNGGSTSNRTPPHRQLPRMLLLIHDSHQAIINSQLEPSPTELLRDANVLGFRKKAQGFFAAFATDTALFHAAERDAQVAHQPAVHPHRAGVDSLGDAMGAAQVLCPDARRKAVFDV